MHQLRRKLEDDPANPQYLLTDAHVGYRFVEKFGPPSLAAPSSGPVSLTFFSSRHRS